MLFCEYIFSKEHPVRFKGFVIIEKQYLIVRIFRVRQLEGLQNLFNGSELHEIFSTSIFLSTSEVLPKNTAEMRSSAL